MAGGVLKHSRATGGKALWVLTCVLFAVASAAPLCQEASDFLPTGQVNFKCSVRITDPDSDAESCRSKGCAVSGLTAFCTNATAVALCPNETRRIRADQMGIVDDACFASLSGHFVNHADCTDVVTKEDVTPLCKIVMGFPCNTPMCSCDDMVSDSASCSSLLPEAEVNKEQTCDATIGDWAHAASCNTPESSELMSYYASKCCRNGKSVCFTQLCSNATAFLPTARLRYDCFSTVEDSVAEQTCKSKGCVVIGKSALCSDAAAVAACAREKSLTTGIDAAECFEKIRTFSPDHPSCKDAGTQDAVTPACKMALGMPWYECNMYHVCMRACMQWITGVRNGSTGRKQNAAAAVPSATARSATERVCECVRE